jgi:hypothetical protein
MTDQEHKLIVMMLSRQYQQIVALTEALISRGVLEKDDLKAYEELVLSRKEDERRRFVQIAQQYEEFAEGLGIDFRFVKTSKAQNPSGQE